MPLLAEIGDFLSIWQLPVVLVLAGVFKQFRQQPEPQVPHVFINGVMKLGIVADDIVFPEKLKIGLKR